MTKSKKNSSPSISKDEEISKLRIQLGGYKTSNATYKDIVNKLRENIDIYKTKFSELSSKIEELEHAHKEEKRKHADIIEEKERVINGLRDQFNEVSHSLADTRDEVVRAEQDKEFYKARYYKLIGLPWYKRIFARE